MSYMEHAFAAVWENYRYFSGNYHFFGCFSEWYGTRKSGMVFPIFGSTSSGQRWFAERRGESSSPQPSATRIRPDFARMECQKYHFGLVFPVSYFHFATDSPQIGQFCAGRRPADENFAPPPAIFDFWQQVAICPRSGIFTTKKWYLPLVGSPAPGALGSPGPAYR